MLDVDDIAYQLEAIREAGKDILKVCDKFTHFKNTNDLPSSFRCKIASVISASMMLVNSDMERYKNMAKKALEKKDRISLAILQALWDAIENEVFKCDERFKELILLKREWRRAQRAGNKNLRERMKRCTSSKQSSDAKRQKTPWQSPKTSSSSSPSKPDIHVSPPQSPSPPLHLQCESSEEFGSWESIPMDDPLAAGDSMEVHSEGNEDKKDIGGASSDNDSINPSEKGEQISLEEPSQSGFPQTQSPLPSKSSKPICIKSGKAKSLYKLKCGRPTSHYFLRKPSEPKSPFSTSKSVLFLYSTLEFEEKSDDDDNGSSEPQTASKSSSETSESSSPQKEPELEVYGRAIASKHPKLPSPRLKFQMRQDEHDPLEGASGKDCSGVPQISQPRSTPQPSQPSTVAKLPLEETSSSSFAQVHSLTRSPFMSRSPPSESARLSPYGGQSRWLKLTQIEKEHHEECPREKTTEPKESSQEEED